MLLVIPHETTTWQKCTNSTTRHAFCNHNLWFYPEVKRASITFTLRPTLLVSTFKKKKGLYTHHSQRYHIQFLITPFQLFIAFLLYTYPIYGSEFLTFDILTNFAWELQDIKHIVHCSPTVKVIPTQPERAKCYKEWDCSCPVAKTSTKQTLYGCQHNNNNKQNLLHNSLDAST